MTQRIRAVGSSCENSKWQARVTNVLQPLLRNLIAHVRLGRVYGLLYTCQCNEEDIQRTFVATMSSAHQQDTNRVLRAEHTIQPCSDICVQPCSTSHIQREEHFPFSPAEKVT